MKLVTLDFLQHTNTREFYRVKMKDYISKNNEWIYAYSDYFNSYIIVASIHYDTKIIYPAHGYFKPHPIGEKISLYAEKHGFIFNNN